MPTNCEIPALHELGIETAKLLARCNTASYGPTEIAPFIASVDKMKH